MLLSVKKPNTEETFERVGIAARRVLAGIERRREEFRDPASSARSAGQMGGEAPGRLGSASPYGGGSATRDGALGPPQPGGSAKAARCESLGPVRRPATARRPLVGTGAHTTRPELAGIAGLERGLVRDRLHAELDSSGQPSGRPVHIERRAERAPDPQDSRCVCPLCVSGNFTKAAGVWAAREPTPNSVPRQASAPFFPAPRAELR